MPRVGELGKDHSVMCEVLHICSGEVAGCLIALFHLNLRIHLLFLVVFFDLYLTFRMSYPRTKSLSPPRRRLLPRHSSQTLKAFLITLTLAVLTFLHYHHIPHFLSPPHLPHRYEDVHLPALTSQTNTNTTTNPRIALITFTTNPTSYTHLSLSNKAHYTTLHNYTLLVDYETPRNDNNDLMWHKFTMLSTAIASGQYDWVWWLDFDTLITNMTTPLASIIDTALATAAKTPQAQEKIDWLLTPDCHALNAGSFLVRAHPRSLDFVDLVRAEYKRNAQSEQDCMRDVLFPSDSGKSAYSGRFAMMSQKSINAFPEEVKCFEQDDAGVEVGRWEKGDFVVHFAGAWAWIKEKDATGVLMEKYRGLVVWEDVEDEYVEEEDGQWDVEIVMGGKVEEEVDREKVHGSGKGKMLEGFWQGDGVSVSISA